jgi:hypothetical protein
MSMTPNKSISFDLDHCTEPTHDDPGNENTGGTTASEGGTATDEETGTCGESASRQTHPSTHVPIDPPTAIIWRWRGFIFCWSSGFSCPTSSGAAVPWTI